MKHKIYFIILFVMCAGDCTFAQPVIKTQRVFGGSQEELFSCMYFTDDGGYIYGGSSYSNKSGDKTQNSRGDVDYWVVKTDASGNIQWDKTIGGDGTDLLAAIQQTCDGGYILGGTSNSNVSGEKTQPNRGCPNQCYTEDYWVVKLSRTGKIEWDKTIGGNDWEVLSALQQTKDSGYILGGLSGSNASGEKTEDSRGYSDYWVVKLDKSGNIQWDKTIGGDYNDQLTSLQQTKDGGFILGGSSSSNISGEKTDTIRGKVSASGFIINGDDYWIVKLNRTGKIEWDKTIGGKRNDDLTCLQQTKDGGFILGGISFSNKSSEKTQFNKGTIHTTDYWVVKVNSKGNIQWDKTIGGDSTDVLTSLEQTKDGGFILGGSSASNRSADKTENSRGYDDYWVVKIDDVGKIGWDKTVGGDNLDYGPLGAVIVKETGKNRFLIGGTSWSGATGDKHRLSRGAADYWVVTLFYKTGSRNLEESSGNISNLITTSTPKNNELNIFPNPAKDILNVQTKVGGSFSLTNQAGKILLSVNIYGSSTIDISGIPNGIYYLKNNKSGELRKIVKIK